MGPSGLIAILAGWFTTEVGRQPWIVYGLQRTSDAVSSHGEMHMSISLLVFIVVYSSVFGVGYAYMMRLIRKGPTKHAGTQQNRGDPVKRIPHHGYCLRSVSHLALTKIK